MNVSVAVSSCPNVVSIPSNCSRLAKLGTGRLSELDVTEAPLEQISTASTFVSWVARSLSETVPRHADDVAGGESGSIGVEREDPFGAERIGVGVRVLLLDEVAAEAGRALEVADDDALDHADAADDR